MNKFLNKQPVQQELFQDTDALKGDEIKQIQIFADKLWTIDQKIAGHEGELKQLKQQKKDIAEKDLPELMNLLGLDSLSTATGKKVVLNTFYDAKIKDREAVFRFLEENGDASIIKDTITCTFDRGAHEKANETAEKLSENGVNFTRKEDIHHATLKAYVKEKIEAGEEIPREAFGAYVGNRVVIK